MGKKKSKIKKAKDFPLGTRFILEQNYQSGMGLNSTEKIPVTLIAYSRQGDEVVVLEGNDEYATLYVENVNDLYPEDYVDPVIPFMKHLQDAIGNACNQKYVLNAEIRRDSIFVENEKDGSVFELKVSCSLKPKDD